MTGPDEYVRQRGLLVPVHAVTDTVTVQATAERRELEPAVVQPELVDDGAVVDGDLVDGDPEQPGGWSPLGWLRRRDDDGVVASAQVLHERLAADRAVVTVGRQDELARLAAAAEHQMALDDIAEQTAAVRRERQERARNDAEADKLAALYRHTAGAGERARIAAEIGRTAEMRALRVAKVQRVSLWAGLVLLVGFGAWSTAGVHGGLVKLMDLRQGSFGWVAGWALEPLLITIVAGLIVIRAVLKMSGGDVDRRATAAEVVALGVSIALNMLGGWQAGAGTGVALGQALAHSVGAIFAALTAWLMGVIIDWTTQADPWTGAKRVTDLDLTPAAATCADGPARSSETAIRRGKRGPLPVDRGALPEEVRKLLQEVREAIAGGRLAVDPSAYAIYKHVMGGAGDRARSTELAGLVRGWRPLRSVEGGVRDVAS